MAWSVVLAEEKRSLTNLCFLRLDSGRSISCCGPQSTVFIRNSLRENLDCYWLLMLQSVEHLLKKLAGGGVDDAFGLYLL
jgi:hypothetical protein